MLCYICICRMIKTTKRQDQMHLPSRSNSLFLIPKAGNRVLIRSDSTTKQLYPIRYDLTWSEIRKIRSDRIRIGFGSDLHISTLNLVGYRSLIEKMEKNKLPEAQKEFEGCMSTYRNTLTGSKCKMELFSNKVFLFSCSKKLNFDKLNEIFSIKQS